MMGSASSRISGLGSYPFAMIDQQVESLRKAGVNVIDFGVGDPRYPTPEFIRKAAARGLEDFAASGYPSYIGSQAFRTAVSDWMGRRFNVTLDPGTEVASSGGSKEAIFNFPEALLEPGDLVLAPNPGYPPYRTGTRFAEGVLHSYPLTRDRGFLPDLDQIPEAVAARARLLWLNYPNSPTGRQATLCELEEIYNWARSRGIVVASDEAYSELYFQTPPPSMLQVARDGVIVFQSLSKRSAMTGYRIGFACGDPELVTLYKKLKTNIDSGVPDFVQAAAIAALGDEEHVAQARGEYQAKLERMTRAFASVGLDAEGSESTIYIWQRVPEGMSDLDYAALMLDPRLGLVVIPGSWLAETVEGSNPGQGFVRWALTPPMDEVEAAARRIEADFKAALKDRR